MEAGYNAIPMALGALMAKAVDAELWLRVSQKQLGQTKIKPLLHGMQPSRGK